MQHPLILDNPDDPAWTRVGRMDLPVPTVLELVGDTLVLLEALAEAGRGHGRLAEGSLFRQRSRHLAWLPPRPDAAAGPDDLVALSRVAAARMGLGGSVGQGDLLQFVGTHRISTEWMQVFRAMGLVDGAPTSTLGELRRVVDALRYYIEPYAAVIRLTMETDAIVRAERKRVVGLRRRLLLARDHARLIEEHVLAGPREWPELVALCALFDPDDRPPITEEFDIACP